MCYRSSERGLIARPSLSLSPGCRGLRRARDQSLSEVSTSGRGLTSEPGSDAGTAAESVGSSRGGVAGSSSAPSWAA